MIGPRGCVSLAQRAVNPTFLCHHRLGQLFRTRVDSHCHEVADDHINPQEEHEHKVRKIKTAIPWKQCGQEKKVAVDDDGGEGSNGK